MMRWTFHDLTGYVPDQTDERYSGLRYGCRPFSYNGCETIACYHALLSLGVGGSSMSDAKKCTLWSVMAYLGRHGMWLWGLFGTYPHALFRFCRDYGLAWRKYAKKDYDSITERVVLYCYWNPRFHGIHTVELHQVKYRESRPCGKEYGYIITNYRPQKNRVFPTMAAALRAIRTPMPILCLGVKTL